MEQETKTQVPKWDGILYLDTRCQATRVKGLGVTASRFSLRISFSRKCHRKAWWALFTACSACGRHSGAALCEPHRDAITRGAPIECPNCGHLPAEVTMTERLT